VNDATPSQLLDAALLYAQRGWAIFPCHSPAPGGGCSCRHDDCPSPGKHPRVPNGLHAATTERVTITRWWRRWPAANVAIRTGSISDLVVIDVDPLHGGGDTLAELVARHGPLPDAVTVRTGSGGSHVYLTHPGWQVRNSTGTLLGPGIDVRGDGGYVIAPPSRHPCGGTYTWSGWSRVLPPVPPWLVHRLQTPEPRHIPAPQANFDVRANSPWARVALEREIGLVRSAPVGQRNATLNRASFCLGQIVAGGGLEAEEVEGLLLRAASAIGLGQREARLTVASGMTAGRRSPRLPSAHGAVGNWLRAPTSLAHCQTAMDAAVKPSFEVPAMEVEL
jgi:hypothetical protein